MSGLIDQRPPEFVLREFEHDPRFHNAREFPWVRLAANFRPISALVRLCCPLCSPLEPITFKWPAVPQRITLDDRSIVELRCDRWQYGRPGQPRSFLWIWSGECPGCWTCYWYAKRAES